jgi:hypothetical protein
MKNFLCLSPLENESSSSNTHIAMTFVAGKITEIIAATKNHFEQSAKRFRLLITGSSTQDTLSAAINYHRGVSSLRSIEAL